MHFQDIFFVSLFDVYSLNSSCQWNSRREIKPWNKASRPLLVSFSLYETRMTRLGQPQTQTQISPLSFFFLSTLISLLYPLVLSFFIEFLPTICKRKSKSKYKLSNVTKLQTTISMSQKPSFICHETHFP